MSTPHGGPNAHRQPLRHNSAGSPVDQSGTGTGATL
jgi:hypothetical protein